MDEEAKKRKLEFRYRRDIGENTNIASLPPDLVETAKTLLGSKKPEPLKIKGGKGGKHINMNPTDDAMAAGMTLKREDVEKLKSTLIDGGFSEQEIENIISEMRLMATHTSTDGKKVAKVCRNSETGEWIVKHHVDGKYQPKADYFTQDKDDAHGTAKYWVSKS